MRFASQTTPAAVAAGGLCIMRARTAYRASSQAPEAPGSGPAFIRWLSPLADPQRRSAGTCCFTAIRSFSCSKEFPSRNDSRTSESLGLVGSGPCSEGNNPFDRAVTIVIRSRICRDHRETRRGRDEGSQCLSDCGAQLFLAGWSHKFDQDMAGSQVPR